LNRQAGHQEMAGFEIDYGRSPIGNFSSRPNREAAPAHLKPGGG